MVCIRILQTLLDKYCGLVDKTAHVMELTVGQVNDYLNQLADPDKLKVDDKGKILRWVLRKVGGFW